MGGGRMPGVAANLVGLAYIAAVGPRPDDARALLPTALDAWAEWPASLLRLV